MNNNKLRFAKVRDDAIIPSKRDEDAGYDVYPNFVDDIILIPPHETVLIPTGIASAFNADYVGIFKERGSTGTKGIAQRSGVIDSGFRNEWKTPITNTTNNLLLISKLPEDESRNLLAELGHIKMERDRAIIYPYSKAICQVIFPRLADFDEVEEISFDELKTIESERGLGMLGSSQK